MLQMNPVKYKQLAAGDKGERSNRHNEEAINWTMHNVWITALDFSTCNAKGSPKFYVLIPKKSTRGPLEVTLTDGRIKHLFNSVYLFPSKDN